MGAVIFETFSPDPKDSLKDEKSQAEEIAQIRDEAYASGFKDGVSVTNDAFQSSQNEIASAIREALDDARLSKAAIGHKSTLDVARLVEGFCAAIAPNFAAAGFGSELGNLLQEAVRGASSDELTIIHSEADEKAIEDLLGETLTGISLQKDSQLSRGQVRLNWENGFNTLDLNEAVARALLQISNFTQMINNEEVEDERRDANG